VEPCLAQGACQQLVCRQQQPAVQLHWRHGLLATRQRLLPLQPAFGVHDLRLHVLSCSQVQRMTSALQH
jgi:hypothetical protein